MLFIARLIKSNNINKYPEYKYFVKGLWFKIIGVSAFISVYLFYYGGGDTLAYFRGAKALGGNRWQNALTAEFVTGRTGNEILAAAQASLKTMGIQHAIYTHPLGVYGHAPGPTIGMWDNQGPTAGRGDWPLYPMTGYAIEGNVTVALPEWGGQLVQMKLEQSALFDGDILLYLAGRQTKLHTIGF